MSEPETVCIYYFGSTGIQIIKISDKYYAVDHKGNTLNKEPFNKIPTTQYIKALLIEEDDNG